MKRMSEVLELPVSADDFADPFYPNDKRQDEYIAHAINHVDALADALQLLLTQVSKVYSTSKELGNAEEVAHAALAAYRGEK